jgi:hypothetical protein
VAPFSVVKSSSAKMVLTLTAARAPRNAVKGVVAMERLRRFAGVDVDCLRGGQQIVGLEQRIADRQDAFVHDQRRKERMRADQRVHSLGAVTFEVVAAELPACRCGNSAARIAATSSAESSRSRMT